MSVKTRNWAARAAIMRKGGVHEKSNKAKRQKEKQLDKKKFRAESFGSFFVYILTSPKLFCIL